MLRYLFFDLDGTLTNPMLGITNSVMYALARFGITETDRTQLCRFIGPPLVDSFMEYYDFPLEKARHALEVYREYYAVTGLYENEVHPGCESFLKEMKNEGFSLVLASSKPEVYVRQILSHFGLDSYFEFIGGSDLEETRVKKAEVISYCLENLGNPSPRTCVMIGDRKHDIEGARAHKMTNIGVLYGFGSQSELECAGADLLAENFNDLKTTILKLKRST